MKWFSQAVIEKIGYYVYFLRDPRNKKIFYVGKGEGNRVFQHVQEAINNPMTTEKRSLINEITPEKVEHLILRHGLTEEMALEIESTAIDLLGLDYLTNEVAGHYSWERGVKTVDEIVQFFDAKEITIEEPAIIININRLYQRFMSAAELYEATRKWWVLGPKRNLAKIVIASYSGLVREVYQIDCWESSVVNEKTRWGFGGQLAKEEIRSKYLNQSLRKYITKGSQNPIKYANC